MEKRKAALRIATLVLGVLTVIIVICAQLFNGQSVENTCNEFSTEQHDSSESPSQLSFSTISLPSTTYHLVASHDLFCLFITSSEKEPLTHQRVITSAPIKKIVHTLLRAFVSPNAP